MRGEVETYDVSYGGEDSGQVEGTDPETHRHTDTVYGYYTYKEYSVVVGMRMCIHYTPTYGTTSCGVTIHRMCLRYGVILHTILQVLCTWVRWMVCVRAYLQTTCTCTAYICGVVYTRTRTYTRMCTCGYAVVVLRITS